ncbi:hypothetical protein [Clostridium ihumii]|uniref:hypothetical protein n=1 Tax=Clostridium ihumii TaxID=1470356 RepID=UPI00058DFC90|nr:hypothetical protein [Clostridium ihumii]
MKIKNVFKWLLTSIQICLIIITGVIYYLSNKKMGLKRSLMFRNINWNNQNFDRYMTFSLIIILSIFIILTIINFMKKQELKWSLTFSVISIMCIIFAIVVKSEVILSYYVLLICMNICLIIEIIKLNFKK